jgi:hypothetical protein
VSYCRNYFFFPSSLCNRSLASSSPPALWVVVTGPAWNEEESDTHTKKRTEVHCVCVLVSVDWAHFLSHFAWTWICDGWRSSFSLTDEESQTPDGSGQKEWNGSESQCMRISLVSITRAEGIVYSTSCCDTSLRVEPLSGWLLPPPLEAPPICVVHYDSSSL